MPTTNLTIYLKWHLSFLILLALTFNCNSLHSQNISKNNIDNLIDIALSRSEKALYKAEFTRARETIRLANFNNSRGFNKTHEIALTIQDIRIENFQGIVYNLKTNSNKNFQRLNKLFKSAILLNDKNIKAGTYGLHINVKDANNATIILSHDTNSWGSFFYDASKDALTADVTMKDAAHKELLTFEFNTVDATSAIASLVWEKKEIPFKIEFDVTDIVLADFRDKSKGNLGFNRQNWEQAANFALNNGGDLDEALGWVDGAIAGQFYSQKTFNNLALKSRILKKMGKADEASSLLAEAASLANTNQLNTLGYQMINAKDYDNALKYFKLNVANNPENANVHDSLGECYKIMGDKKNAVKYLKKSLSLNPPANVKANSEKLLGELGESI